MLYDMKYSAVCWSAAEACSSVRGATCFSLARGRDYTTTSHDRKTPMVVAFICLVVLANCACVSIYISSRMKNRASSSSPSCAAAESFSAVPSRRALGVLPQLRRVDDCSEDGDGDGNPAYPAPGKPISYSCIHPCIGLNTRQDIHPATVRAGIYMD